jgi:hypothetical protein
MESTAPATSSVATPEVAALEIPRDEATNRHWRMTGEFSLPEKKDSPKAESATAKQESSEAAPDTEQAESASAPDAEHSQDKVPQQQTRKRGDADSRLKELLADLKTAGLSPKELKTFKREAAQPAPKTEAASSPAPVQQVQQQPQTQELKPPVKPKMDDYKEKTWDEWQTAQDDYYEKLAEFKSNKAILEYRQQQIQQANMERLSQQLNEGRQRYKDFDTVVAPVVQVLERDLPPLVSGTIDRSPVFVDLLYVIGGDKANMDDFIRAAKANPLDGVRRAIQLEQLVIEELNGKKAEKEKPNAERNANGQFVKSTPEKKTVTSAPAIGTEVNSRAGVTADEREAALKRDDFNAYREAQNARDMQERKSRRR